MSVAAKLHLKNSSGSLGAPFEHLRQSSELCDVTLACDDGPSLQAHRLVLAAYSPVLREMFGRHSAQQQQPALLLFPTVGVHTLQAMLGFLYTGEVSVEYRAVTEFLGLAQKLGIEELCSEEIMQTYPKPKQEKQTEVLDSGGDHFDLNQQKSMEVKDDTTQTAFNKAEPKLRPTRKPGKKRSLCWKYMTFSNSDPKKVICNICKKGLMFNNKISNFVKHMMMKHGGFPAVEDTEHVNTIETEIATLDEETGDMAQTEKVKKKNLYFDTIEDWNDHLQEQMENNF